MVEEAHQRTLERIEADTATKWIERISTNINHCIVCGADQFELAEDSSGNAVFFNVGINGSMPEIRVCCLGCGHIYSFSAKVLMAKFADGVNNEASGD